MAVTYETGVASSPIDLLNKLDTFLGGSSWATDPPSSGDLVIHNGASGVGICAGIDATATEWQTRAAENYSGAVAWNLQPGHANFTHLWNIGAGPYTAYHFYEGDEDGNDYIHITVEKLAGEFRHWALGRVVPFGAITGGVYCDSTWLNDSSSFRNSSETSVHRYLCDANSTLTSSSNAAHFWVDYDSKLAQWQVISQAQAAISANECTGSTRNQGLYQPMHEIGYQRYNLRTPLWPMIYFANRASSLRSPVGRMPNIRQVNMRNLFPGEELTIGGDVWKCFPVFVKQTAAVANTVVSSDLYGYAHLMP